MTSNPINYQKKNALKGIALLLVASVIGISQVLAQPDPEPPGDGTGGTGTGSETGTPIDGGLTILAAAGVAYGGKKYKEARQKRKQAIN